MAGVVPRADLGEIERAKGFDIEIKFTHGRPRERKNGRAIDPSSHRSVLFPSKREPHLSISCLRVGSATGVPIGEASVFAGAADAVVSPAVRLGRQSAAADRHSSSIHRTTRKSGRFRQAVAVLKWVDVASHDRRTLGPLKLPHDFALGRQVADCDRSADA